MASLGLDLGDDDMLNDGNDGSAPLADCVDGTAPPLPLASAGTSGEGGAADATEAAAANGLDERLRTMVPMFHAAGRVSVDMLKSGLVHYGGVKFCDESLRKRPPNEGKLKAQYIRKATPGTTWSNGAYTRRTLHAVARAATGSGGEPQPDRWRRQSQARPAPSCAVAAGRQSLLWRGAPRVGAWWTRHRHVASALLCKDRFTDLRFHRKDAFWGLKKMLGGHPPG